MIEDSLATRRARLPPHHYMIAQVLQNLAALKTDQGGAGPEEAVPLLEEALMIEEKAFGPDHYEVRGRVWLASPPPRPYTPSQTLFPDAQVALTLGTMADALEEIATDAALDRAVPLRRRELAIFEKAEDEADLATACNNLGLLLSTRHGTPDEAEEAARLVQRAQGIQESIEPESKGVLNYLGNYHVVRLRALRRAIEAGGVGHKGAEAEEAERTEVAAIQEVLRQLQEIHGLPSDDPWCEKFAAYL